MHASKQVLKAHYNKNFKNAGNSQIPFSDASAVGETVKVSGLATHFDSDLNQQMILKIGMHLDYRITLEIVRLHDEKRFEYLQT